VLESKTFSWVCFFCVCFVSSNGAAEPLLLIGEPSVDAKFLAATGTGTFQFQVAEQTREVTAQQLVRWSTASSNLPANELLLVDGSRLALAESWTGQQSWQLAGDTLLVTTKLFGKLTIPRDQLHAIFLHLPLDLRQRTQFVDQLRSSKSSADRLFLTNGDQLTGKLLGLVTSGNEQQIKFMVDSTNKPHQIALARVAAIACGFAKTAPPDAKLVIGLRDGSQLRAQSLVADATQLDIKLAGGMNLRGSDPRDIAQLRSLEADCLYLSDLPAVDYRHVPYFNIPWPYESDRNVLAGPLRVANRTFAKGIGMITAARLTYRLDVPEIQGRFSRFVADVAVDDAAARRGSVIFRVYLQGSRLQGGRLQQDQDDPWQLAYTSPVLRGGEAPAPVTVELGDAQQILLATDFADRGDECDYANWLDARLESVNK